MADVQTIKATLLLAAYEAAVAALGNATPVGADGKPLTVVADSTVQDPGLRAKNLAIYETAKVHFTSLVNAFQDKTGVWPDPKVATEAPVAKLASPLTAGTLAVAAPGAELAGVVSAVAGALAPMAPAAGVVGQVASAVNNALANAAK